MCSLATLALLFDDPFICFQNIVSHTCAVTEPTMLPPRPTPARQHCAAVSVDFPVSDISFHIWCPPLLTTAERHPY